MEVKTIDINTGVKFEDIKPGECFFDTRNRDNDMEIKLDTNRLESTLNERQKKGYPNYGCSASLETGEVFFYNKDCIVYPVNAYVVERGTE